MNSETNNANRGDNMAKRNSTKKTRKLNPNRNERRMRKMLIEAMVVHGFKCEELGVSALSMMQVQQAVQAIVNAAKTGKFDIHA